MWKNYIIFSILLATIACVMEINALHCWRCSTDTTGEICGDPFNPDQIPQQRKRWMYVECNLSAGSSNSFNMRPVCMKSIRNMNGKEIISRSCTSETIGTPVDQCMSQVAPYSTNIFCETCSIDGCNAHSRRTKNVSSQQENRVNVNPSFQHPTQGGIQKVLVTDRDFPREGLELLRRHFDVITPQTSPVSREELLRLSRNVDGILWATNEKLNRDIFNPRLKAISVFSDTMEHVDQFVQKSNLTVAHIPDISYPAIADLAIGLMIAASRRFNEARKQIENPQVSYSLKPMIGQDIERSTVGIIGFSALTQKIAKRLHGFDVEQVLFTTQSGGEYEVPLYQNEKFVSMDDLVTQSDYIIVAIPLTNDTRNLVNSNLFRKMKPTSVLVNIASGEVVNTNDLANALRNGMIFAAGIDGIGAEPVSPSHPLMHMHNCVVTPHLRSATVNSRREMANIAAQNLIRALKSNNY